MTRGRIDAVFTALSDPTRRQVMQYISEEGGASASELAERLPVTRQAIAKHLAALNDAGLVHAERAGRQVRYRLTPGPMGEALDWMTDVGGEWDERLHALQRFIARRDKP